MARVTVEDCLDKVENRFELVLVAGIRGHKLNSGGYLVIIDDDAENTIVKNAVNTVNANNYFWINYTQYTGGSKYYEPGG